MSNDYHQSRPEPEARIDATEQVGTNAPEGTDRLGREVERGNPNATSQAVTETARESRANWMQWFRSSVASSSGFEGQRYLTKWMLLSTAIGIVAGLGAVLFAFGIHASTEFFLGRIVGYLPPAPVGEGAPILRPMERPWLLPLVVGLGGLASGVIVFSLAPEAEGHGTDAAIDAIHHKRARMRARVPPIKLVASAITIGTGGSGGREGPAAQISAGFGSLLGRWLNLDVQDRRIAVAAGMGAGIGAIFRAPLGGAVMAAEILYIHDLEVEALIPALIAAIVGYSIFGLFYGFAPIFGAQPQLAFGSPIQLVYYAALGVVCGLGGLLYAKSFYGITAIFHRLKLPRWLKPALGGLLVGVMGLLVPGALHTGYGFVQISMDKTLFDLPLWMVLILPFAKILATSLSIGSGGSGGIFGPGMVIGGLLGASFWRVGHTVLPQMPVMPAPFVIVGMMALFGGIAHAPLAVMLMVAEMTGNLSLLAPAMVAVAVSTALVGNTTIYRAQLPSRASSPAHRVRFSFPLLSSLLVRDAMAAPGPVIRSDAPVSTVEPIMEADGLPGAVVVNDRGQFIGVLLDEQVQRVPAAERAHTFVSAVVGKDPVALDPNQTLDVALEKLANRGLSWAPVVENNEAIGQLNVRDVLRTYKDTLARSVHRATALAPNTTMFEARLGKSSPLAGHLLHEVAMPREVLVVSITRDGETIFPRGNTRLEVGDIVMIMTNKRAEPELRSFLETSERPA